MAVNVICPHCDASYQVAEDSLGRSAHCQKCGEKFILELSLGDVGSSVAARKTAQPQRSKTQRRKAALPKLGRFEIRAKLGAGGFGTVYRAYDAVLEREVALKVPNPGALESEQDKARYLREPKAAAQLRHPNIVPIYDASIDGDNFYIASAFIEGETLQHRIKFGKLDLKQSVLYVMKLAMALDYAHSTGIVHRDVKPSNVMVDTHGEPLLMDFGLAKLQESFDQLTADGSIMGTPAYMSPEQAAGRIDMVGPASDQYSLGVVLYELLCGERPFSGPPAAVVSQVVNQAPPPPSSHDKQVPKDLETICLKAMSKHISNRYASCQAMADDLNAWFEGRPIQARPIRIPGRLLRWCRRQPAITATLAVAITAVFAALMFGIMAFQGPPTDVTATSAADGPESRGFTVLHDRTAYYRAASPETVQRVRTHRDETLSGLSELDWSDFWTKLRVMATSGDKSQMPAVPERCLLVGYLRRICIVDGRAWLHVGPRNDVQFDPALDRAKLYPHAVIELSVKDAALTLADYRVGELVRVAVRSNPGIRDDEIDAAGVPVGQSAFFDKYKENIGLIGKTNTGPNPWIYFSFTADGVERNGDSASWVGRGVGRAGEVVDEDSIRRNLSFTLRCHKGLEGQKVALTAQYYRSGNSGEMEILSVNDSTAGRMYVVCRLDALDRDLPPNLESGDSLLVEGIVARPLKALPLFVTATSAGNVSDDDEWLGWPNLQIQALSIKRTAAHSAGQYGDDIVTATDSNSANAVMHADAPKPPLNPSASSTDDDGTRSNPSIIVPPTLPTVVPLLSGGFTIADEFDDGELDRDTWRRVSDPKSIGTATDDLTAGVDIREEDGKLKFIVGARRVWDGLLSRVHLSGDFDVMVDYEWKAYSGDNRARLQLTAYDTTSNRNVCINNHRIFGSTNYVALHIDKDTPQSRELGTTSSVPLNGTLRLSRRGSNFIAYYMTENDWAQIAEATAFSNPVEVYLAVHNIGSPGGKVASFEIHIDRFEVRGNNQP